MSTSYTGFPRFKTVATITPKIKVSRLSGVIPAAFHFSICDTEMPGGLLENGQAVMPWRDLHVEWDFGDPNTLDRMHDARYGVPKNPNTDQVGPEAFYIYRTPGTYTVTAKVKARTGRYEFAEATTTTLRTNQRQIVFLPKGTTGSFRLEWPVGSGNWTPYRTIDNISQPQMRVLLADLQALPGIGESNLRAYDHNSDKTTFPFFWIFEFCNALGGATQPFIGIDTTQLSNPDYPLTNLVWEYEPGATASQLTVTDGNMSYRYYDPENGSDTNNGLTAATPRKTWADMITWLQGASPSNYRTALIKRGTAFPSGAGNLNARYYTRLGTYGEGARPVVAPTSTIVVNAAQLPSTANENQFRYDDVVIEGIDTGAAEPMKGFALATAQYPSQRVRRVYFIDCQFRRQLNASFLWMGEQVGLWNNYSDGAEYMGHHSFYKIGFFAQVGGTYINGQAPNSPSYQLDHFIYPLSPAHELYRWVDFQPATALSRCYRGNAMETPGPSYWRMLSECYLRGASTGAAMEWGGEQPPYYKGRVNSFIVDGCWIKVGSDRGMQHTTPCPFHGAPDPCDSNHYGYSYTDGSSNYSSDNYVVRNCRIWAGQRPVGNTVHRDQQTGTGHFDGSAIWAKQQISTHIYGNAIWLNGFGTAIAITNAEGSSCWYYIAENVIEVGPIGCYMMFTTAASDAIPLSQRFHDRNVIWINNAEARRIDRPAFKWLGVDRTLAYIQGVGLFGPNDVFRMPAWQDKGSGKMNSQRGASIGAIAVKLQENRGWPRGNKP